MNQKRQLILFAAIFLFLAGNISAQQLQQRQHWKAHKVEAVKGSDCIIISYIPLEYNATPTPRDDKNPGEFYFVSGSYCAEIFGQSFKNSPYRDEHINPTSNLEIDLSTCSGINTVTSTYLVGEGATKLYLMYFSSDNNTPDDPRDDEYLGVDFVIDSGDPDIITKPFELDEIKTQLKSNLELFNLISAHSYYTLREMIINENLVVEKLRKENKLKDITPKEPKMTKERLRALLSMQ